MTRSVRYLNARRLLSLLLLAKGKSDLVLLEGFMLFFDPAVASLCDMKIWLDVERETITKRSHRSVLLPASLTGSRRLKSKGKDDPFFQPSWENHIRYTEHCALLGIGPKSLHALAGWQPVVRLDAKLPPADLASTAMASIRKMQ